MYKILFLDFDGVLIPLLKGAIPPVTKAEQDATFPPGSYPEHLPKIGKTFDPQSMSFLRTLCRDPEVRIVISSFWRRKYGLGLLKGIFEAWGFDPNIIFGETPLIGDGEHRGREIQAWLLNHFAVGVKSILILDDQHYDLFTLWPDNFILCQELLRNNTTQLNAKRVLDTEINYENHPIYLNYLKQEKATEVSDTFNWRSTQDSMKNYIVGMMLKMNTDQLFMHILNWVVEKKCAQHLVFDLFDLTNLSEVLKKLAQINNESNVELYIDPEVPVEFVLHYLSKAQCAVRLHLHGNDELNQMGVSNWFRLNQWAGSLAIELNGALDFVQLKRLATTLAQPQHQKVTLFTDADDGKTLHRNKVEVRDNPEKFAHLPLIMSLGPDEEACVIELLLYRVNTTLQLFLLDAINKELFRTNEDDFELSMLLNFIYQYFSNDNIGVLYRTLLQNCSGVKESVIIDHDKKIVSKLHWQYVSYFLTVQFEFDTDDPDSGFIFTLHRYQMDYSPKERGIISNPFGVFNSFEKGACKEKILDVIEQQQLSKNNFFHHSKRMVATLDGQPSVMGVPRVIEPSEFANGIQ